MGRSACDWKSFWDISTPEETARILAGWYGPFAVKVAVDCALAASGDGREEDYRFWYAVFARLCAEQKGPKGPPPRRAGGRIGMGAIPASLPKGRAT